MVSKKSLISRSAGFSPQQIRPSMLGFQCLMFIFLAVSCLHAAPFKLLAIGDSLSDEYDNSLSLFFSAPDSNPGRANTKNWVELLHQYRPTLFSMGAAGGTYLDYRYNGYEYNYGSIGLKAQDWDETLNDPSTLIQFNTRRELRGDLSSVNAVLIFIGGNDLSLNSNETENDVIRVDIGHIHDYVRANAPTNLPIIVATVPDIGVTPKERITDPTLASAARSRVATMNAAIIADLSTRDNTYIARIDNLTDRIWDQVPFQINGTEFINSFDRQNPPLYLFCKEQFHPTTAPQALIANEILREINKFAPTPIPLFSNREILTIIGQNPDKPYLDYAGTAGGILENPDGDALPNLVEYLLNTSPTESNPAFTFLPGGTATFTPSPTAQRFADLTVLQSETLSNDWIPVPQNSIQTQMDGTMKIIPTAEKLFYKFQATPKP